MIGQYLILFVQILFQILYWMIFVYIILSWVTRPGNKLMIFLRQTLTPIFRPFRWARIGIMDLSPLVALFAMDFGRMILVNILYNIFMTNA